MHAMHAMRLTPHDAQCGALLVQPFCRPAEGIKKVANMANLGTILEGLRIENSPYNFTVMVGSG